MGGLLHLAYRARQLAGWLVDVRDAVRSGRQERCFIVYSPLSDAMSATLQSASTWGLDLSRKFLTSRDCGASELTGLRHWQTLLDGRDSEDPSDFHNRQVPVSSASIDSATSSTGSVTVVAETWLTSTADGQSDETAFGEKSD